MHEEYFHLRQSNPDTIAVTGMLGFATAAAAMDALNTVLARGPCQRLDLSGLHACDSAGLACVLAVLADAAQQQRPVCVVNMPAAMRSLAQVSGVDEMLEKH